MEWFQLCLGMRKTCGLECGSATGLEYKRLGKPLDVRNPIFDTTNIPKVVNIAFLFLTKYCLNGSEFERDCVECIIKTDHRRMDIRPGRCVAKALRDLECGVRKAVREVWNVL